MITQDLGIATAYGYAKSKGYTGTEAEFAELMASYASTAQTAIEAADRAVEANTAAQSAKTDAAASKTAAQTAAQTATTKASEASQSASTATTKASEASTSADTASAAATSASMSAQTATTAAATATTKASEAEASEAAALSAKTDAESARDAAAQSASAAAESARTLTIDPTLTQTGQAADAKATGEKINAIQSSVSNVNASVTYTASGVKYPTPATMDMFERVVYDFGENIGFAPQGLAVHNGIAYVCNGATAPLNVIGEINLTDGSYVVHRIEGLVSGGNSVTLDYENNILYVASHNDRGLLNVVDINTWTLIKTIRMSVIEDSPEPNIVYDPSERCFYNCCCFDKIYKLDDTLTPIEVINLDVSGDNYPTAKPGTPQGFGYDGTFFYVPRSEVYHVSGNSFTFVYNKKGEFIKYFKGLQKEIEEYAYDFSTGKSYMCYAFGTSGWISEFVTDSGWLDMKDYISNDFEATVTPSNVDVANSTAQFRVINGMVMFKGYLKVDSFSTRMGKVLTFFDGRLAPALHTTGIAYKTDGNVFTSPVPVVVEMSYFNPYVTPNYRYKYSPIRCEQVGYIWLDGIIAPCGRR